MATSYHCFLREKITIEEDDGALPCHFLFIFLLKYRKEGDDNLLSSPSLFQQHHIKK
jgi:hypothetical protein